MAASCEVEEAGEEEGDGEEERGGGGGATNNLVCLTQLFLKISDNEQKIRLASIQQGRQNALPSEILSCFVSTTRCSKITSVLSRIQSSPPN